MVLKIVPLILATAITFTLASCDDSKSSSESEKVRENKEINYPFYISTSIELTEATETKDAYSATNLYTLKNNKLERIVKEYNRTDGREDGINDQGQSATNSLESSFYYIEDKKLFKIDADENTPQFIDDNVDFIMNVMGIFIYLK